MIYVAAFLALIGHAAMFVAVVNRYHAIITTRRVLKILDLCWYVLAAGIPAAVALWLLQNDIRGGDHSQSTWFFPICTYTVLCLVATACAIIHRAAYAVRNSNSTPRLVSNHTKLVSLTQQLGYRPIDDWVTTWCSRIPGNEILQLSIHQKHMRLNRLDSALDGLTITHLSDLHLTGKMSKDFYRAIVDATLELNSDMIMITGDIVENKDCLPWIPELFGRLKAPLGVYYVLGNHEQRIQDESQIRSTLDSTGMVGLGGRCHTIRAGDRSILVAGTEMPWYPPAPDMEMHALPDEENGQPLRVLLSHSPDQLRWARHHQFDLMLAGHTHGGQVHIPIFGPILSPSRNGIRHAGGTFDCPPTLLHVSRGLSGTRPLRINCPPEIAQLSLHGE